MTTDGGPPVWLSASLSLFCACSSALFSGLTLSLMTYDVFQLQLLTCVTTNNPKELKNAEYARRIMPLRKDGYLLLSTLIVGNVMSNVALSILIGGLLDQLAGFLISTVITTILGEIAPQAIFIKHALYFGSLFAPFVRIIQFVLYPIVKPISLVLSFSLGSIKGTIYNKNELKALFDVHRQEGNVLSDEECMMLKGCLDIAHVKAKSLMTPLNQIFGLSKTTKLTTDVIRVIAKSGYSKIPIVDYSQESCIVGMIYTRDLLKVQLAENITCDEALLKYGKPIYALDEDVGLITVLSYFHHGTVDFAIVRRVVELEDNDPYYKHVGILTLKTVINKIIQVDLKSSQYFTQKTFSDVVNIDVDFNEELISKICNEFNPIVKFKLENILNNTFVINNSFKLYSSNIQIFHTRQYISGLYIIVKGSISIRSSTGNITKQAPCILHEPVDLISLTSILHNPLPNNIIAITVQELEDNLGNELVTSCDVIANEETIVYVLNHEESLQILSLIK